LALVLASVWAREANARLGGVVAASCTSCHGGGKPPAVSVSIDPLPIAAGAMGTITVRIAAPVAAGFYLTTYGVGSFQLINGQGARLATPTDVVHAAPKPAVNGQVTFQVGWMAPATRGTVVFETFVVAANGDRTSGGDAAGQGRLSVAVGCQGVEMFVDTDGDGFGSSTLPKEQVC